MDKHQSSNGVLLRTKWDKGNWQIEVSERFMLRKLQLSSIIKIDQMVR